MTFTVPQMIYDIVVYFSYISFISFISYIYFIYFINFIYYIYYIIFISFNVFIIYILKENVFYINTTPNSFMIERFRVVDGLTTIKYNYLI